MNGISDFVRRNLKVPSAFLSLLFLCSTTVAFSGWGPFPRKQSSIGGISRDCSWELLPATVRDQLRAKYSSWRIQDTSNLCSLARQAWDNKKYKKPSECPGIAVGKFENTNASYAVLLVPQARPDSAYRFLVFSRNIGRQDYRLAVLDQDDDGRAQNFFIRSVPIVDFFFDEQRRELKIGANEGILLMEAAEKEYGAEVFFWTTNGYRHEQREY